MAAKSKIVKMFTGISRLGDYADSMKFLNISLRNIDPPAYIVRIILIDVLGLPDYGPMDKVDWHTMFDYRGRTFLVRDYKFGSWSIESNTNDKQTNEIALEIEKKVKMASNFLDKILYEQLKDYAANGSFFIANLNRCLASIFYFYLDKTKKAINDVKDLTADTGQKEQRDAGPFGTLTDLWNKKIEVTEIAFNYAYAMIHAFYSYMEFLLDVLFAFEQPSMNFWEFRKKSWADRFKIVFDLKVEEIREVYVKLQECRKRYRNPLSHGLTSEISVLVPLPHAGLIPLSYEFLSNELYYGFSGINDIGLAEEFIEMFSLFLDYLKKNEPYSYYLRYAEYNFAIPVDKQAVEEIKKEMSCPDEFEEYLHHKATYEDAIINREI